MKGTVGGCSSMIFSYVRCCAWHWLKKLNDDKYHYMILAPAYMCRKATNLRQPISLTILTGATEMFWKLKIPVFFYLNGLLGAGTRRRYLEQKNEFTLTNMVDGTSRSDSDEGTKDVRGLTKTARIIMGWSTTVHRRRHTYRSISVIMRARTKGQMNAD